MLFQMGSGDTLTAVLAAAANTTNPAVKVDYRGVSGVFSDYVTLTDDAAVTLFTGPEKDNPVVTGLSVCNVDDAAITITLKHVRGGTAYTVLVATLAASDTLVVGVDGVHVTDSAGNQSVGGVSLLTSLTDDTDLALGDSDDVLLRFSTGDASNHAAVLALDNTSQALHVTDKAAVATDWNISGTTHPNVYVHSNTTPATDYLRIGGHDGSKAEIDVVGGTELDVMFAGAAVQKLRTVGFQDNGSASVTATTGGATTGLIPEGASFVTVTSDSADKQISLPAATIGDVIRILVGATGCELISAVATHKVNNVVVGATNELALVATSLYRCEYVATNTWIVTGLTNLGAAEAALVPDALA